MEGYAAFEMVNVLSSPVAVEGKLETDRNRPVKINVFRQKADNTLLSLNQRFWGHLFRPGHVKPP